MRLHLATGSQELSGGAVQSLEGARLKAAARESGVGVAPFENRNQTSKHTSKRASERARKQTHKQAYEPKSSKLCFWVVTSSLFLLGVWLGQLCLVMGTSALARYEIQGVPTLGSTPARVIPCLMGARWVVADSVRTRRQPVSVLWSSS